MAPPPNAGIADRPAHARLPHNTASRDSRSQRKSVCIGPALTPPRTRRLHFLTARLPAWLAKNPPDFGQHNPAMCAFLRDSDGAYSTFFRVYKVPMWSILAKDHFQILGYGMAHTGHPAPVRCGHKTTTKKTYTHQYTRISAGCELLPKGAAARNQLRPGASPRLLGCPSRP